MAEGATTLKGLRAQIGKTNMNLVYLYLHLFYESASVFAALYLSARVCERAETLPSWTC